ncbi:MAG: family NAD(P)-dependent oxidoreductase [Mycobacterium sp.]|nr:family NAD(P)-dependent oxidoreductase [Mycobacterium sp.]
MRIVIAGGHGKIALHLAQQLHVSGHQAASLIRNPAHADDVTVAGGEPIVLDLEQSSAAQLAEHLAGADAVVFAAGAGPGSTAARKLTVDRDGATLLIAAAKQAGVDRYVMVSAMGADSYDPESEEIFQIYLRAKSDADAALRESGLDWTIVRPGGLTDEPPTGGITIGESLDRGTIPRADVAAVVLACLGGAAHGRQFELISGPTPIADALAELGS